MSCVEDGDMPLVEALRHDFGERSLPATVNTILLLHELDVDSVSSLACVDHAAVNSVTEQRSFAGVDDFAVLFLRVVQTVHADSGQSAVKRRRYDDEFNGGVNDVSSAAAVSYAPQNQSWNSVADFHRQQRR